MYGQVERSLATQACQQSVWTLTVDHQLQELRRERLDIGTVCDARIGHDRGRVGVDQHRGVALFSERPARLGTCVIEFGRLADDDRPRPDDQDLHTVIERNSSNRRWLSWGPGQPSGWYCTENTGSSRWRRPSTDPSFRFTCETSKPLAAEIESATT